MTAPEEVAPWFLPLDSNPLPWPLADETPAIKHLTLRHLLDRRWADPDVKRASAAAMREDPISAILACQASEGYWLKMVSENPRRTVPDELEGPRRPFFEDVGRDQACR